MSKSYARLVKTSVTNFLHCEGKYLFVKRALDKSVDAGKINGIGGKLDPGENYLEAAIRETEEETGYKVLPEDCTLTAIVNLEGGYDEDWIVCFFFIEVPHMDIPVGNETEEGEFMWLTPDELFQQKDELVDDLHYLFKDAATGDKLLFMNAQLNSAEKIENYSLHSLKLGK